MSEIIDCMVFIVQKTCWSLWKFVEFVGLRFLDLLGLIFNVLACATIIRLPCMIRQFQEMKSMSEWRYVGLVQFLIFLMDVPVIIMGLITLVLTLGLILIPFVKKVKRKKVKCDYTHSKGGIYFGGFKLRGIVVSYFVRVICDMFCIPLGFICLCSWRCCIFLHKIKKVKKWDNFEWRKICVVQFIHLLVDIPCVICGVFLLFTWRGWWVVHTFKKFKKENSLEWNMDRFLVFSEMIYLVSDVFFFVIAVLTLVTWRGPLMVYDLIHTNSEYDDDDDCCSYYSPFEWELKFKIFKHLVLIFVDIPCIICAFIVMITIWRFPTFIRKCTKDEWKLRKNCLTQFALLMVDFAFLLLNIVCVIISVFVIVTLWRAYPLVRDLKKYFKQRSEIRSNQEKKDTDDCQQRQEGVQEATVNDNESQQQQTVDGGEQMNDDNDEQQRQQSVTEGQLNDNLDKQQRRNSKSDIQENNVYDKMQQKRHKKAIKKLESANSWKIRKAILKHFGFLFIDFPAIAACLILLITVVRLPKLLAKLLQAGDFYLEFALIAFMQLGKLVVDLVFLILFIVLMILRPIQSWVHLLEDEDHRKNRLLRFYMQWVPDIIEQRHQMYREMEEVFSTRLKNKLPSFNVRVELSLINAEFLRNIQWVRDKIAKYDLDGEYSHLLRIVQFYEGKRAFKMERLYQCELNYLHRVDTTVHNENLTKYRNEMIRFESQVDSAIQALNKFTVSKVPLWSEECGLRTRTRQETQKVLIKCLPSGRFLITILILLNLILVYRGPALICNLYRRWYDRRKIVFASMKEYMKDFLTLLIIFVVIVTLYRAPFLLIEISNDIISKRSWTAVRETVRRYPPKFAEDLADMVILFFSWKTVRFIFTAILFGLLMPADLFLTVMKFVFGNLCLAAFCTLVMYIIFFGFPFILSFGVAPSLLASNSGDIITVIIGVIGICLVGFLVLAAILTFKNRGESFSLRPKAYDYVRFNWTNTHTVIFEVVECLQLLALVFVVPEIPMYGSAILNKASNYLLLNFASFDFKFWMTTTLFIAWFFICGLPVIFEQILETFPKGTFAKQISWTLLISLFTNTLFVTMVESFLGFVACKYSDNCPTNSGNGTNFTDCPSGVLYDAVDVPCWTGSHTGVATFGLLALVWYSSTSIIFGTRYGDSDHPSLDLKFSPVYNTLINFAKAIMVGVSVLAAGSPLVVFSVLIVLNIGALIFTLCFRRVAGFMLSNSFVLIMWRIVSFVCAAVAAFSTVIAKLLDDHNSIVPLCIFLGGTGIVLVLAIVVSIIRIIRRALTPIEHKRKEFRTCIKQLEERLVRDNRMVISWERNSKRWRRLVSHVYEAQNDEKRDRSTEQQLELPGTLPPSLPPDPRSGANRFSLDMTRGVSFRSSLYEIQSLPPPPSYQELFPHIMTPFDGLPPPPPYSEDSDHPSESVLIPNPIDQAIRKADPNEEPALNKTSTPSKSSDGGSVDEALSGDETTKDDAEDPANCDDSLEVRIDINAEDEITQDSYTEKNTVDESGPSESADLPSADEDDDAEARSDVRLDSTPIASLDSEIGSEKHGKFDSLLFLESNFRSDEKRKREPDPVLSMECNGKNLLLVLEEHIHYSAYSFAFLSQLPMWRHSVECADWTRLIDCFRTLDSNLNGAFNFPSRVDIACADLSSPLLKLPPDPDKVPIPTFVPEPRDPDEIRELSNAIRIHCLQDVATVRANGEKWMSILDKVLPTKPLFKNWIWDDKDQKFEIHFRRVTRGTIADIGPRGVKLAKGAVISIPKVLKGQFVGNEVKFVKGSEPKGSKGPVSVTIGELGILQVNDKLYITAQGKRLAFDKALDCLYEVIWK